MKKGRGMPWKKAGMAILEIGVLAAILYLIFRDNYQEIWANLTQVGLGGLVPVLAAGLGYFVLDAAACQMLLRSGLPNLSYREAMELTWLGVFCNVATFSAGILPTQSLYLLRRDLDVGSSMGLLIMKYVAHKGAILVCAGALLFINWQELLHRGLGAFAWTGLGVCTVIVACLLLLCTWEKARRGAAWVIDRLPSAGKWAERKKVLTRNLNALYSAARTLSGEKKRIFPVFLLNILKLFSMYTAAFLALRAMGEESLTWGLAVSLAALAHLVAGILPNVAGMGPAEASFLWAYSPFLPGALASSALVLYRFATYFFPFLVSVGVTGHIRGRMGRSSREKNDQP